MKDRSELYGIAEVKIVEATVSQIEKAEVVRPNPPCVGLSDISVVRWHMPSAGLSPEMVRWGAGRLSPEAEARFVQGATYCGNFFMGQAETQLALLRVLGSSSTPSMV